MIRRFNRFELKYIISPAQRDALVSDMAHNMGTDAHGDAVGSYRVTSLYYDSPDDACYRAKIEGIKYRRKVRVRIYGTSEDELGAIASLEIKQRINRTVQKRRLGLPLGEAYALAGGGPAPVVAREDDRQVAAEVELLARMLMLRPACVISYLRQAFVGGQYEPGLRITFDQDLEVRGPERLLGAGMQSHHFMRPEELILEVKANDTVPLWVTRMLSRHGCTLTRVSKYCAGLSVLRGLERSKERFFDGGDAWTSS